MKENLFLHKETSGTRNRFLPRWEPRRIPCLEKRSKPHSGRQTPGCWVTRLTEAIEILNATPADTKTAQRLPGAGVGREGLTTKVPGGFREEENSSRLWC